MAVLSVYVDDVTLLRLQQIAIELDRSIEDLAESAVSEATLQACPEPKGKPR